MAASRSRALLGLVDSESEDDLGVRVATKTTTANKMPGARRGRPAAASKVTKPAPKGRRRSSDRIAAAVEQVGGRKALADKTNEQPTRAATKDRKPDATAEEAAKPKRGRPRVVKVVQEENREVLDSAGPVKIPAKRGRKPAAAKVVDDLPDSHEETEIPETQQAPEPMDIDDSDDIQQEEPGPIRRLEPTGAQISRGLASAAGMAGAAGSDHGESALRRRLSELAKKYEALEASYHNLREIGIEEAERNFDKLRKQGDEKTKGMSTTIPG